MAAFEVATRTRQNLETQQKDYSAETRVSGPFSAFNSLHVGLKVLDLQV